MALVGEAASQGYIRQRRPNNWPEAWLAGKQRNPAGDLAVKKLK
jgi:hypothetical protein